MPSELPQPFLPEGTAFTTTQWTVILEAGDQTTPRASEALTKLCATYWAPLYAFLRREGRTPHEAEDLVQGFFERFLAHDYLRDVSREKGRFRSFLLASLRHFVANQRRGQHAQKRGGAHVHFSLDVAGTVEQYEAAISERHSPEVVFDQVWAETVIETAARRLREEYERTGKGALYEAIRPWLAKEAVAGDYAPVAEHSGVTEGAVAVAVHRMRRRFHELVRDEVAQTLQSPADLEDEMRHLLRVLTSDAALLGS